jgi:hypothetical protein
MALQKFTDEDQQRLSELNKQIFKGESFVEINDLDFESPEMIEYEALITKKQRWLKFLKEAKPVTYTNVYIGSVPLLPRKNYMTIAKKG